jgi:putative hemolysin
MKEVDLEVIIIFVLILLNGLFAMSEIAIVASRKSKLMNLAQNGNKGAKTALQLLDNPEDFLSSVQIGITLVGIIAGAYGGTALAEDLMPYIKSFGILEKYSSEIAFVLVVGSITYFSLIIGELVPKTIAFNNPERIASLTAPIMRMLTIFTKPVIGVLSVSTKIVLKLFLIKPRNETTITEEELKYLIEQGTQQGTFEKYESEIFKSIFRFSDRNAGSIMTPRKDVIFIDKNSSLEQIIDIMDKGHKRIYPVCDNSLDDLWGIVDSAEYLKENIKSNSVNVNEMLYDPIFIPETLRATKIIEKFRYAKKHFAVVINEHGTLIGVITLHDIIENILGDLPEIEDAGSQPKIFERNDNSWLIDGIIMVDELNDKLNINIKMLDAGFVTLGGFVMEKIGRVPATGEYFEYNGYSFEVVDMDDKRVDKVLVKKLSGKE